MLLNDYRRCHRLCHCESLVGKPNFPAAASQVSFRYRKFSGDSGLDGSNGNGQEPSLAGMERMRSAPDPWLDRRLRISPEAAVSGARLGLDSR